MTDELVEIEKQIKDLEGKIHGQAQQLKKDARRFAKANADYKLKEAEELVRLNDEEIEDPAVKRTEKVRNSLALQAAKEEYREYRIAEMEFESTKDVIGALKSEMSGLQTRAGLFKLDMELQGRKP